MGVQMCATNLAKQVSIWKLNSVASVRERTIPTERPQLSVKLVQTFADRVVRATDPYGRILSFLDRSRYFFFQVGPQLYSPMHKNEWRTNKTISVPTGSAICGVKSELATLKHMKPKKNLSRRSDLLELTSSLIRGIQTGRLSKIACISCTCCCCPVPQSQPHPSWTCSGWADGAAVQAVSLCGLCSCVQFCRPPHRYTHWDTQRLSSEFMTESMKPCGQPNRSAGDRVWGH
jgi:hypothetical protein